jgi:replicative DNA helicase
MLKNKNKIELYDLTLERHILGGILKFPAAFYDIDSVINENDFHSEIHSTIFCVIRALLNQKKGIDKVLISQKITELGLKFDDNLCIDDYLDTLDFTQITRNALLEASKELFKYRIRRHLAETGENIIKYSQASGSKEVDDLITGADKIYGEYTSAYELTAAPQDLLASIDEIIQENAKNPVVETGLTTHHREFNRLFGGIKNGNVYAWVSRPGHGKTTFLDDIAYNACLLNKGCKALLLDTEMDTIDIKYRMASALTGVPTWYLETGKWATHDLYKQMYETNKFKLKALERGMVQHMNVSSKSVSAIESIVSRWFYKEVGRGNPCVIVYDYIKLTGEKDGDKKEYQLIGDKVNSLKELTLELQVPLLTACQLNRSAESGTDDSSAIAQSDRLQWFSSYVGIFRRKTHEEIGKHGESFGTHMLKTIKSRFQGQDATGHNDLVRVEEGDSVKYYPNFINYRVNNFQVQECGSLRDIIKAEELKPDLNENKNEEALLDV